MPSNNSQPKPQRDIGRQQQWKNYFLVNGSVLLILIIFQVSGSKSILKALDSRQFHQLGNNGYIERKKTANHLMISSTTQAAPPSLFCLTAEETPKTEATGKCRRQIQYFAIGMVKSGTAMLKEVASFFSDQIKTHQGFPEFYHFQDNYSPRQKERYMQTLGYLQDNPVIRPPPKNLQVLDNTDFIYGAHSPNQMYLAQYRHCSLKLNGCDDHPDNIEFSNVTAILHQISYLMPRETLLIAALRDPTKRAVSQFSHFAPKCPELWHGEQDRSKCFHDMVIAEIQQLQTCFQFSAKNKVDCVMLPFDHESKGHRLVGIGLYAILLEMWLEFFPNFCLLDIINKDWQELGRDLGNCLGVTLKPPLNQQFEYKPVSKTATGKHKPWNITLNILDNFYAPYNHQLCKMAPHTCQWDWVKKSMDLL